MPPGRNLQSILVALEQGRLGVIVKAAAFFALIVTLVLLYLFVQFKGLRDPSAIDQAQIARNLAKGEGFTTKCITPRAIQTFVNHGRIGFEEKPYNLISVPDIYSMPLAPWLNSLTLSMIRGSWKMDKAELLYAGDRMIAFTSMIFLLLAVGVWYFVIARLFDHRVAILASAVILLTDLIWQFSLAGLPQMLVMLLFGCAMLATIYAEREQERANIARTLIFLGLAGLSFGLMILTHGLSAWIFVGWCIFVGMTFSPRGLMFLVPLGVALIAVIPWLVRNFAECGNPFGLAILGMFDTSDPFTGFLRLTESGGTGSLMSIVRRGVEAQTQKMAMFLGVNLAALFFFAAVFHPFRNALTGMLRWGILLMWVCATIGMCFFTPGDAVSANQLHVVFIPIFAAYGFAFLLVLWGRWEINQPLLRSLFIALIIFLCAVPMLMRLLSGPQGRVQWPPYVPPFIAILGDWFEEDEMVASDMPYAVAWYADRHSLLLPETLRDLNKLHDYRETNPVVQGVYLTPVSGNQPLFSRIYDGPFASWARLITRPPVVANFPFPVYTPLPIQNQCIIYTDRPRWLEARRNQE